MEQGIANVLGKISERKSRTPIGSRDRLFATLAIAGAIFHASIANAAKDPLIESSPDQHSEDFRIDARDALSKGLGPLAALNRSEDRLEQLQLVQDSIPQVPESSFVPIQPGAAIRFLRNQISMDSKDFFTPVLATNQTFDLPPGFAMQIKTRQAELSIALPGEGMMADETYIFEKPIMGLHTHYPLMDGLGLYARGDFDVYSFEPETIWEAEAGFDFAISRGSYLRVGYRFLGIHAEKDTFSVDDASGPQIQFGFRF